MNRSRTSRICALGCSALTAALSAIFATGAFATDAILHNFTGGVSDGSQPYGSLALLNSGSTLYGMTSGGGSGGGNGTIFSMNVSGSGFNLMHSFDGNDGAFPTGSLSYDSFSQAPLYGMTLGDGTHNQGTIFTINTNGSGFGLLHTFTGSTSDGGRPFGSLLVFGSLYGMTSSGGTANDGVTFSLSTGGTGFTVQHSFTGAPSDGMSPQGSYSDPFRTYGTTRYGGSSNQGTLFSGNSIVHNFTGATNDGAQPFGSVLGFGNNNQTLIGMTEQGGSSGKGVIYEVASNGAGFTILHNFTGGPGDGAFPLGSLIQIPGFGSKIFGTTENGGAADDGVVFSMNIDGSGFTILNSFTGGTSDGANPQADLAVSADRQTLYGTTLNGGSAGDGTVFSVASGVPEPAAAGLCALGGLVLAARRRR